MQLLLISVALVLTVISPSSQSDEVYCGVPPLIEFATLEEEPSENSEVGTIVSYSCQFGYYSKGRIHTSECKIFGSEQNAEWTEPQFSCSPQACGDPGYVINGRRIGSLFAFPNSVTYECNVGYKLKGLSTRYCQASGVWSGRLPVCEEITCPPPRNLENGNVVYSTLNFGSELIYKCDKGFRLTQEETVFCTSEGKWSNANVQCIESVCVIPENPEYGSVISDSNNKLLAGSIAFFSCEGDRIPDGPTTSKCLETGQWTFPPPKCLEPCRTPYVTNGFIGYYATKRNPHRTIFQKKNVGSRVKDDEVLYLRCSEGYEVFGSVKNEESVSCKNGKWSHEIQCEPASCKNRPPSVENAQAVSLNPEHGGGVLYLCDEDFKKTVNETIICDFGTWKGNRPVCKNTRCFMNDLTFPGLVKGRKSIYRHGEIFDIQCGSGYQVINASKREIRCVEGTWEGLLPPCVAASCVKPPPKIDHGGPKVYSTFHSSIIEYTCEDHYILTQNYKVQCLFGEWTGQLPKCEDSMCYIKTLQNAANVDFVATDKVTLSGYRLNVMCIEGYSPSERPICLQGKWNGNSRSPCKENDCTVPILYHGDVKETKISGPYWSWRKFKYVTEEKHVKISAGTILPYSTSVTLFCHDHYFFQGSSVNSQKITCYKGKWLPHPVCLPRGQRYIPQTTTRRSYTKNLSLISEPSKTTTTTKQVSEIPVTETLEFTLKEVYETEIPAGGKIEISKVEPPEDEFSCEYPINDENLIAHADGKKLKYLDKVKNGSVVIFRCKYVGYHHLNGPQNIKCEDYQIWHSSEFPTCSEPKQGSAVILFDKTLNISIEGNLEARKGQDVQLICVAYESGLYPYWSVPNNSKVTVRRERMEREFQGDILYVTHLVIENVDIENEGPYGCAIENNTMNFINLVVIDPNLRCPEFQSLIGISVTYTSERRVKSQAVFSCTTPFQKIDGKAILTCKNNGEWSNLIPQCTDVKCRELKSNDLLEISYTNDRKVGSKATFHCFVPGKRSGASFADCLEDGIWSQPTPTCSTPPCAMENIITVLPEYVVLDTDNKNINAPYNTTVKLTCSEDMIVVGDNLARCNRKGEWVIGNIQCISGCPKPVKDPDSSVIFTSNKDIYKLGEMVTFLCPPGMGLTTDSQLIMCLKHGWSETILPDCQYKK